MTRINEEKAFNLASGIFTVPVPGIYHFNFSAVKLSNAAYLTIYLQINGANVGTAATNQYTTGSNDVVCLSASLRLVEGDTVNLWNAGGTLWDRPDNHNTHFTGWLVEEDLV